jgi:hypothetical protein
MPSLISHVASPQDFFDDLNYLNLREIKLFCSKHGIPYAIQLEHPQDRGHKNVGVDRKGVLLDRVRRYLLTGTIPKPTVFPASVVCFDVAATHPRKTDRLFYGRYRRNHVGLMALLKDLTGGEFKDGAIARMLANEFWSKGIAPTYEHYAAAWLKAKRARSTPRPEWAFLSDRAARNDTTDWKRLRADKAKRVMRVLNAIPPKPI